MTDEEIKKIAREYAEYCCRETDYEGDIVERNMDLHICSDEVAMPLLEWLSKNYCIVPKSKVKEKYALAKMGYTECEGLELGYVMDALEDIFGKDTFEEEGE